jgi:hypothetical protein
MVRPMTDQNEGGTMQYRAFVAAAFAAALAVPIAFGAAAKKPPTGPGCKPAVSVILRGTLMSDPEFVGAGFFMLNTTGGNKAGKVFVGGVPELITVGADTKVRRQNAPKLIASLELGDRAVVHLRACKATLPLDAAELTALTALRVNAKAPAAP